LKDRYQNKQVDLEALKNRVVQFFQEKGFSVSEKSGEGTLHVVAFPKTEHDILEEINVYVTGHPDDFEVIFDSGSRSRTMVRYGILTNVFGGGRLTLKGLKSQEALEKVAKEFWVFVDSVVWSFSGSP
jgi:hypothetical protein